MNKKIDLAKELIFEILIALIFAYILTSFVSTTIVIGNSMNPTFTDKDYLIINRFAYKVSEPQYKDIIVFKSNVDGHKNLIKRIIATEGDKIRIIDGQVYVNDIALNEPYLASTYTSGAVNIVVPHGKIFVMGDNRNHSLDSRFQEVGLVSVNDIIGKVLIKIF